MGRSVVKNIRLPALVVALLMLVPAARSQDLAAFEKRLTKFTLDNGLTFLVLERHEAPVISFHTYADVGAVDEVKGFTGLAHLFEHMAFKGTQTVGTRDYQAEAAVLAKMDDLFVAIRKEKQKGDRANPETLKQLQEQFDQAGQEAQKYVVHDEYETVLTRQGARGFNAYTSEDATQYVVSLPSNKLELWMMLEADRFAHPVLREFYKEKDVVMEERRMRTENSPTGRLYEEFQALAYLAHPYGEPVIGHMSDVQALSRSEAEAFFKAHYGPSNLTIALVGDVDPGQRQTSGRQVLRRHCRRVQARAGADGGAAAARGTTRDAGGRFPTADSDRVSSAERQPPGHDRAHRDLRDPQRRAYFASVPGSREGKEDRRERRRRGRQEQVSEPVYVHAPGRLAATPIRSANRPSTPRSRGSRPSRSRRRNWPRRRPAAGPA